MIRFSLFLLIAATFVAVDGYASRPGFGPGSTYSDSIRRQQTEQRNTQERMEWNNAGQPGTFDQYQSQKAAERKEILRQSPYYTPTTGELLGDMFGISGQNSNSSNTNRNQELSRVGFDILQTGGTGNYEINGINGTVNTNGQLSTGGYGNYQVQDINGIVNGDPNAIRQTGYNAYAQRGGAAGVLGEGSNSHVTGGIDSAVYTLGNGGSVEDAGYAVGNQAYGSLGGGTGIANELGLTGNNANAAGAGLDALVDGGSATDVACAAGSSYFGVDLCGSGGSFGSGTSGQGRTTRPVDKNKGVPVLAEEAEIASVVNQEASAISAKYQALSESPLGQELFASMANSPAIAAVQAQMGQESRERFAIAMQTYLSTLQDTSPGSEVRLANMSTCFATQQAAGVGDGQALIDCTDEGSGHLAQAAADLKAAPTSPIDKSSYAVLKTHLKEAVCANGDSCAILAFVGTMSIGEPLEGSAASESGPVKSAPALISVDDAILFTKNTTKALLTAQAHYLEALGNKYGSDNIDAINYAFGRQLREEQEALDDELLTTSLQRAPLLQDLNFTPIFFAARNDAAAVRAARAMNDRFQKSDSTCSEIKPHKMFVDYKIYAESELAKLKVTDVSQVVEDRLAESTNELQEILTGLEGAPSGIVYPDPSKILAKGPESENSQEDVVAALSLMKAVLGCKINHYVSGLAPYEFYNKIKGKDAGGRLEFINNAASTLASLTVQQLYEFNNNRLRLALEGSEFMTVKSVGSAGDVEMRREAWFQEYLSRNIKSFEEAIKTIPERASRAENRIDLQDI